MQPAPHPEGKTFRPANMCTLAIPAARLPLSALSGHHPCHPTCVHAFLDQQALCRVGSQWADNRKSLGCRAWLPATNNLCLCLRVLRKQSEFSIQTLNGCHSGCHLKLAVFSRTMLKLTSKWHIFQKTTHLSASLPEPESLQAPWRLLLQPLMKATQFVQVLGLAGSTIRAMGVASIS